MTSQQQNTYSSIEMRCPLNDDVPDHIYAMIVGSINLTVRASRHQKGNPRRGLSVDVNLKESPSRSHIHRAQMYSKVSMYKRCAVWTYHVLQRILAELVRPRNHLSRSTIARIQSQRQPSGSAQRPARMILVIQGICFLYRQGEAGRPSSLELRAECGIMTLPSDEA